MATLNTKRPRSIRKAPAAPRRPQLPPQPTHAPVSNWATTHQGAPAVMIPPELQLRRSVCSCMLWEDEFYESGEKIADRIVKLVRQCQPQVVADLALDVRSNFNLRHVPLLMVAAMADKGKGGTSLISRTIEQVIQRADEITEFLAIYCRLYNIKPLALSHRASAQVKKGIAAAFRKFDQFQLARYFTQSAEKNATVKARYALIMSHPKPKNKAQGALWQKILDKEPIKAGGAGSWEVESSRGVDETVQAILAEAGEIGREKKLAPGKALKKVLEAAAITEAEFEDMRKTDKRSLFERQLRDGRLGYLALLRNLRNMTEAHVDPALIEQAILARRGAHRVLPFQFLAAARACPRFEPALDQALSESVSEIPVLPGRTVVLVDVSGSMYEQGAKLSLHGWMYRGDAAAMLASIMPGDNQIFTFSERIVEVPQRFGMAGVREIENSQPHGGTQLQAALNRLFIGSGGYSRLGIGGHREYQEPITMDRLVVITDEQAAQRVSEPPRLRYGCYMINVASAQNGVGYGGTWTHIDGFSEHVLRFIAEFERLGEVREAA